MGLSDRGGISGTGKAFDQAAIAGLERALRGQLIRPGHPLYESSRHVWNLAFDKHPALIVRCAGAGDVVRAVDFARRNDLRLAVRSGGHSFAGHSTCDRGMVIDFSAMRTSGSTPNVGSRA
jgi:FAD/FMN-containing dehydrogenase